MSITTLRAFLSTSGFTFSVKSACDSVSIFPFGMIVNAPGFISLILITRSMLFPLQVAPAADDHDTVFRHGLEQVLRNAFKKIAERVEHLLVPVHQLVLQKVVVHDLRKFVVVRLGPFL